MESFFFSVSLLSFQRQIASWFGTGLSPESSYAGNLVARLVMLKRVETFKVGPSGSGHEGPILKEVN